MKQSQIPRSAVLKRNASLLLAGISVSAWISGCGSGSVTSPVSSGATATKIAKGRASFTFTWPKRAASGRLIPVASNSIQVSVAAGSLVVATQTISRPSNGASTASVTFNNLNVGNYTVTATSYPNADGSGIAQASAQTTVTVVQNQVTPFSLTMGSTIATLNVALSAGATSIAVGQSLTLNATPMDSQGNIVLITSGTLQWLSSVSSVATVDGSGAVTGIAAGSTTITVTETESGKSATCVLTVTAPVAIYNNNQAVSFQINPGHSGSVTFGQALTFPTSPTWSVNLGSGVSYPVIAGGKIFVTVANPSGTYGTNLYALDEATGQIVWGPIALGGTYWTATVAYDNGKLFAINFNGLLQSFDAATGTPGWSASMPGQYEFEATPTAVNGVVYIGGSGSGGTVYAVNETNGSLLWTAPVESDYASSPAVSLSSSGLSTGVFVSSPCQVYDLNPGTGAFLWHYDGPCEGGFDATAAYANGLVYVRSIPNGNTIINAVSGTTVGAFNSGPIPAFNSTMGFFLNGNTLQGVTTANRQTLWSFAGDGRLASAPIVIDQAIIVGSASGKIYALDAATGTQLWTGMAGAGLSSPNEGEGQSPQTGLGAGEGYLVAPAGSTLTAWKLVGP